MYPQLGEGDGVAKAIKPIIGKLVETKRSQGLKYVIEEQTLIRFLRHCMGHPLAGGKVPQGVIDEWFTRRGNEKANTHEARCRIVGHMLAACAEKGLAASVPDLPRHRHQRYQPYIFSFEEAACFLDACDSLAEYPGSSRHIVAPVVFRLMLCCGLRSSEAAAIRTGDVDLASGTLIIKDTKNRVDRRVPMDRSMTRIVSQYSAMTQAERRGGAGFFFQGKYHEHISRSNIYHWFRFCLDKAGIPHKGKGHGPRAHDLRHVFCVYSLRNAFLRGVDIQNFLPVLSAYVGHKSPEATQYYLRLTSELYPDVLKRVTGFCGHAIPSTEGDLHDAH